MNIIRTFFFGIASGILIGTPALFADDTDIFTGVNVTSAPSNILLSIDTSGSMRQHVLDLPKANFDPTATYADSPCTSDYAYELRDTDNGIGDSTTMPYVAISNNNSSSNSLNQQYIQYMCEGDVGTPTNQYSCDAGTYEFIDIIDGIPGRVHVCRDYSWVPSPSSGTPSNSGSCSGLVSRIRYTDNYLCGLPVTVTTVLTNPSNPGLYDPNANANSNPDSYAYDYDAINAFSSNDCPAESELAANGYFINEQTSTDNNGNITLSKICSGLNQTIYMTGDFINHTKSLLDTNGHPTAGWDNFYVGSRLQVVKNVVNDIISNQENLNINLGIMRFINDGNSNGGVVASKVQPLMVKDTSTADPDDYINNTTLQTSMQTTVNSFVNYSGTPLEESMYEAYRYFTGKSPNYGNVNGRDTGVISNSLYNSPVTHVCQKNSLILLTDGNPSSDGGVDGTISTLYSNNSANLDSVPSPADFDSTPDGTCSNSGDNDGACMDELAQILSELDHFDDTTLIGPDGNTGKEYNIKQSVTTHTVGFFNNNEILRNTAGAGDGITRLATNSDDLKQFFTDAIKTVVQDASSFSAPSISVNSLNRLENLDDLYFSIFEPSSNPVWVGNVKKYKLKAANGIPALKDANDANAVDTSTDKFFDTARSFWTPSNIIDGNKVPLGGFASRLTTTRNVYSSFGFDNSGAITLSSGTGTYDVNNTNVTLAKLGLATGNVNTYVDWLNGVTTDTNGTVVSTKAIGDTLHTTPVVITYNTSNAEVTSQSDLDQSLFFGTNSGFIHGIDVNPAASPANMEHFAFIPEELLSRVPAFYENTATGGNFSKLYGMDGPISRWIEGDNGNGIVNSGEKAHIYATMRRGGGSIYALDVTDPDAPKLEWTISNATTGFAELGQTWSQVIPTKVKVDSTVHDVLVFGGGYDPDQDNATARTADDSGRAIYIVHADSDDGNTAGSLLWKATYATTDTATPTSFADTFGSSEMKYSIPSNLSVLDVVGNDGIADRIYFGDMGGQLWRFDLLTTGFTGGIIADLSGANEAGKNSRRFYSSPSVARVTNDSYGDYLAITIGSGMRANPKSKDARDKFYMIKDPYVFAPKLDSSSKPNYDYLFDSLNSSYGRLTDLELAADTEISDITSNGNPTPDQIGSYGWFIEFPTTGEKVLNPSLIADDTIIFTSYEPEGQRDTNTCEALAVIGQSYEYRISLFDGSPVYYEDYRELTDEQIEEIEANDPGQINVDRRQATLPGLSPPPQLVITGEDSSDPNCISSSSATLVVGNNVSDAGICTAPVRTYWNRYESEQP